MRICEKSSNFVVNFIRLIKKEVQMRKMRMILACLMCDCEIVES